MKNLMMMLTCAWCPLRPPHPHTMSREILPKSIKITIYSWSIRGTRGMSHTRQTGRTTPTHEKHGMNIQVIAPPGGHSPVSLPNGARTDLRSDRHPYHGIIQACLTRQILLLADRAFQAPSRPSTPYNHQQFNRDHARLEHPANAPSPSSCPFRILRRARCSTRSRIIQAIPTLLTCDYSG